MRVYFETNETTRISQRESARASVWGLIVFMALALGYLIG